MTKKKLYTAGIEIRDECFDRHPSKRSMALFKEGLALLGDQILRSAAVNGNIEKVSFGWRVNVGPFDSATPRAFLNWRATMGGKLQMGRAERLVAEATKMALYRLNGKKKILQKAPEFS